MCRVRTAQVALLCLGAAAWAPAQAADRVDFARDVMPVFRQNCVPCHGPTQQNSGMRLDRKSVVLGRRGVVPGSAENSFLFHRISGSAYGMQMPPTGALKPEQIATIKKWIDQGADWPDALANEAELPPPNAKAVAMVDALHQGNLDAFLKQATAEPALLNARGPEGSTSFMYAVLYSNGTTVAQLLKLKPDVNKENDAKATALMWAATDFDKTKLLVGAGADVNARSSDMRTALMIAARRPGNSATVKLLLEHGAKVNPNPHPGAESSPLIEAAGAGDATTVELLLTHGAEVKDSGEMALEQALNVRCVRCADKIAAKGLTKQDYTVALNDTVHLLDAATAKMMIERGADVNTVDPMGRTPLMYAAASDLLPLDVVKLLVEHGADVNARDIHKDGGDSGLSVLDIARLHGETPIVEYLVKAGAKSTERAQEGLKARGANTIAHAITASLPLIQKADAEFMPKAACASCHNNSFAALAVSAARRNGLPVDEVTAAQQVRANVFGLEKLRDYLHQGFLSPVGDFFGPFVAGYMLLGLDAEHYQADLNTDAVAIFLKSRQNGDGEWPYAAADTRPPICSDYVAQTAVSMRALQLYAPRLEEASYEKAVRLAATWLEKVKSRNTEDRTYRLLGLTWAGTNRDAMQKAMRELLDTQRADGGWSDLESMGSSTFASGKALYALQLAGLPATDAAYRKAVQYLLGTQQEDGSWYVRSRAMTFQPYFDSGFPHGFDQWISAAGTSWATVALAGVPADAKSRVAGGNR